mgnify:CR=1 FL=1
MIKKDKNELKKGVKIIWQQKNYLTMVVRMYYAE